MPTTAPREPGGPRPAQIAMVLWLFALRLGALTAPLLIAFALLVLGFASIAAFDPPVAIAGLVLLLLRALHG